MHCTRVYISRIYMYSDMVKILATADHGEVIGKGIFLKANSAGISKCMHCSNVKIHSYIYRTL